MPAKFTRLEWVIIVAALVVLIFSNRPPESGNASIREDVKPVADVQVPSPRTQPDSLLPDVARPESVSADDSPSDNQAMTPLPPPQPKPKQMVMVDARKCDSLKYPHIMVGEITARRVWNGTTFEWRTVCEVKERNGTTTVWNLDDRHEGVIISEMPPDPTPTY